MKSTPDNFRSRLSKPRESAFAASLRIALLRTVRLYTFYTPISRGKYRVFLLARSILGTPNREIVVPARNGVRFSVDFATEMQDTVFFIGEYEKSLSKVVESLLMRGGDRFATYLDIGANVLCLPERSARPSPEFF